VCIACDIIDGELKISDESQDLQFINLDYIDELAMHPRIRARIIDFAQGVRGGLNPG
jgi:hypothetical protein